jgi:hypothetical protein
MVLRYDPGTHEAAICSAWGQDTDWIRNIRVRPALQVQIGRESFTPQQRFLSRRRAWPWWPGSGAPTRKGCACLNRSWAGGSSLGYGRAGLRQHPAVRGFSARRIPHEPGKAMPVVNEDRANAHRPPRQQ